MSAVRIDVDRLQVALHGVPAALAEDFPARIGRALEQRLRGLRADAVTAALDLGLLELGRIDLTESVDAGALAGIVADRLVEVLAVRCCGEERKPGGGDA
jgi:predicted LPLAT superfamily acyltransferase